MLILGNLNTLLIHTSLKLFSSHSETVTKVINNTGTSTSGPITVVKATGEAFNPKVVIATASANSKLLPAAKEIYRFGTVANRI